MSELINNRQYRQKKLKEVILELHDGKSVEEVQEKFSDIIAGISPEEIAAMEQAIIDEGMPIGEVQRLCDVHAAVFKGSLADFHQEVKPEFMPGHPVDTFRQENRALERLMQEKIMPLINEAKAKPSAASRQILLKLFDELWEIDKHYGRKENLLFPYLEKYGITAPPQVMWGVDDEIREAIKQVKNSGKNQDLSDLLSMAEAALNQVNEMIYKEENILFPMSLETLTADEWAKIERESAQIGFCLYQPPRMTETPKAMEPSLPKEAQISDEGSIDFETGNLNLKLLTAMLDHLPIDFTFVDKNDVVRYFSNGKERIFHRTKSVIGRKVENCHPPGSVHIVEKLVADFKAGIKDSEDFWIKKGEAYILIRYFAVRDEHGDYLGTLEVSQDIKPFQEISGEKRLMDD